MNAFRTRPPHCDRSHTDDFDRTCHFLMFRAASWLIGTDLLLLGTPSLKWLGMIFCWAVTCVNLSRRDRRPAVKYFCRFLLSVTGGSQQGDSEAARSRDFFLQPRRWEEDEWLAKSRADDHSLRAGHEGALANSARWGRGRKRKAMFQLSKPRIRQENSSP